MRIILVTVGLGLGGAERLIVDLSRRLVAVGDDVIVVSLLSGGELIGEAQSSGATVVELGFRRGRPSPRGWYRYWRLLRDVQPDVVHASMFHANLLARLTRLLHAAPCVISSAHNVNERGDGERSSVALRLRETLYRATDGLSELTSQVSPAGAQAYVERHLVAADRMRFVPNGIDVERFLAARSGGTEARAALGIEPTDRVFITVGAMTQQKNQVGLVQVFERLLAEGSRARLLIVGDGPLRDQVEQSVRLAALGDHVRILGARRDVPDLLAAADVFVLPSRFEGMPLVLLEALVVGLPAIATDVGAVPEVLGPSGTGWLVPQGDDVGLLDALREADAMDEAELERRGAIAQRHAIDQFGIDGYVARWRRLYAQLAAKPPVRRAEPAGDLAATIWN